ncbi:MAG: glutamine--fructose-6-phosphate transaminase (isomerizing) [bacterium]|nr:glutamine--fructose-6-phosphate transaminase (isomerizing) [bacterium]
MCGIVGYIGSKDAVPILIDGLRKLEYRGYDSAGVAVITGSNLELRRSAGKIINLEEVIKNNPIQGNIGIAHTRWATHGRPCEENAHPHCDCHNQLVIVHNGIIENYAQLKEELIANGHHFRSQTDTEVIAHLIEEYLKEDLSEAVRKALTKIEGAYALGVISLKQPDRIIAARLASPLIVGMGDGEFFIASDVPAILPYTRQVIFLEDKELAILTREGVEIRTLEGTPVQKTPIYIEWDPIMAEKGGYRHFMLKEIHEQPRSIEDTIRGRIVENEVYLDELNLTKEDIANIDKIFIVACGTAYYAGVVGRFMLEGLTQIPTETDIASEFRYRNPILSDKTLLIAISQSGETADTLAGIKEGKEKGAKVISICNVIGSSLTRESNEGIVYTRAGIEIGVASTKAFTSQLTALYLLAVYLGRQKGVIDEHKTKELLDQLRLIPREVENILTDEEKIKEISHQFQHYHNFLYLGRGINFPIALEGALKLKEISYIHAEGYPAGEMKHGPIALIDENMPVVAIATQGMATPGTVYDKIMSNIEEAKARDGIIIAVASSDDTQITKKVDYCFYIPKTTEFLTPILAVIPLQLLAYHIANYRGCDVDQPRNLAKSVTVE